MSEFGNPTTALALVGLAMAFAIERSSASRTKSNDLWHGRNQSEDNNDLSHEAKSSIPSIDDISSSGDGSGSQGSHLYFQLRYLLVWTFALLAECVQDIYIIQAFRSYGMPSTEVLSLLLVFVISLLVFGSLACCSGDKIGRKNVCLIYCCVLFMSTLTKLVPNYNILLLSCVLSGISSALLVTSFESWMICEHKRNNFDNFLLSNIASNISIACGFTFIGAIYIANSVVGYGGYAALFTIAFFLSVLTMLSVSLVLDENLTDFNSKMFNVVSRGYATINFHNNLFLLGLSQSMYDASLFLFALPTISMYLFSANHPNSDNEQFMSYKSRSCMMVVFIISMIVGSSLFKLLCNSREVLYKVPLFVHLVSTGLMALITLGCMAGYALTESLLFYLLSVSSGMLYPAYSVIKAEKVPEEVRNTIMVLCRAPFNCFLLLVVLLVYLIVENISPNSYSQLHAFLVSYEARALMLVFNTCLQAGSFVLYRTFYARTKKTEETYENESANTVLRVPLSDGAQSRVRLDSLRHASFTDTRNRVDSLTGMGSIKIGRQSSELNMYLREWEAENGV